MRPRLGEVLFGTAGRAAEPVLLSITPPRTGERTLLGVENLLGSIAVPEPFSLEMAGDAHGVTLMARCVDGEVVRGQIAVRYPQARIAEVAAVDDPLCLGEGEQAFGMTLRSGGPDYAPLRTFRDDDLLDPGSDPVIALMGALSSLNEGERVVARLLLRSLGPDWAEVHRARAQERSTPAPQVGRQPEQESGGGGEGMRMAALGAVALVALRGYLWVKNGEVLKAALLGIGVLAAAAACGWVWTRLRRSRDRAIDPLQGKGRRSRASRSMRRYRSRSSCRRTRVPGGPRSSFRPWPQRIVTTTTPPGRASR